jgi:hypothetical protein
MFARKVAARLKPNSLAEFKNLMEWEILPWLRQQEGFIDLIMLAGPDGTELAAISFWKHRGNAQTYHSSGYPEVLKTLEKLLDGTPSVKTFEVVSSTLQRLYTHGPTISDNSAEETGSGQAGYPQNESRL